MEKMIGHSMPAEITSKGNWPHTPSWTSGASNFVSVLLFCKHMMWLQTVSACFQRFQTHQLCVKVVRVALESFLSCSKLVKIWTFIVQISKLWYKIVQTNTNNIANIFIMCFLACKAVKNKNCWLFHEHKRRVVQFASNGQHSLLIFIANYVYTFN